MGPNATVILEPIVTTMASMLLLNLTEEDTGAALNQSGPTLWPSNSSGTPLATTASPEHSSMSPAPCGTEPAFPSNYGIRDVIRMRGMENGQGLECSGWLPINHIYFQLANIFLFLSYLAPNGIYGILYLRITLTIGCMFFSLWGWVILCAFDTFLWNAIFVLINLVHVVIICYYLRPVRFTPELEQVYKSLFQPLKVSRHQFKRVINCMKLIRYVKFQEIYAQEKITRVDSLSLVLSGRLVISQNGRALHIVSQHQFLDSPEWFGVSTDEFFQVSATAIEDSRVLIWHRDKLKLTIMGDQFLQAVFDHILGRDVVKKLMQVNESLSGMGNGHCIANLSDESETKPLLVVKKGEESGSITAIINRQLQEHLKRMNAQHPQSHSEANTQHFVTTPHCIIGSLTHSTGRTSWSPQHHQIQMTGGIVWLLLLLPPL
ncbi:popeye domain-containing protein 3-like isoform X4 [Portunus trituberculatus]|uniref:popeye domain-containing protein 3-like isoform X4 n=1 Tax=Portunus trituberculatus TaxID=210409 RepID=UPI001E1CF6E6|nr:popeye domain-containing protein 3-like isoform X4 [Portunus trituberculatus]